ncbi:NACHT and WD repeat domain-containing protein 2 [Amia ocellicauda]|uniref:NACHT and WD repeat domain-containing protein 2 n=1 Tax=Amia ocellicauda TaxID=2972642 RepID=UPI0034645129
MENKYFTSVLERELRFALENRSNEDVRRCLCYVHKIFNMSRQRERTAGQQSGLLSDPDLQAFCHTKSNTLLCKLREDFLPCMVASSELQVYTSTTTCELRQGYTSEMRQGYIEGLCKQFYTNVLNLIDVTVSRNTSQIDSLTEGILQQADLCSIYSHLYRIQCAEVEQIKTYLTQKETKYPLIVSGGPCTGKTVFLAHCAKQADIWLRDKDPVIVVHFIKGDNDTLKQLLSSVCQQVAVSYGQPLLCIPKDISQLKEDFLNLLSAPSEERPLVLILDGLDQISEAYKSQSIWWLPRSLPPNVKFLISTAPRKFGILQALKALYTDQSQFVELAPKERKDCSKMLTELLFSSKRRVTSGQQIYVNKALNDCSLTLYVELLHRQVSHWRSDVEITGDSVRKGVHENIKWFLDQLEEKHGKEMVSKAICYLTLAKSGITETELTDLLSSEDNVLMQFLPQEDLPLKLRVPESAVEKLLLDLKGFLVRRYLLGSQVLFWVSRHFPLVIYKLYLSSDKRVQEIHNAMSNYFNGRWAYGRAKPLIINQGLTTQTKRLLSPPQAFSNSPLVKIYIDRQQPSQPWLFKSFFSNLRKTHELPFHLKASGRLEELSRSVMLSLGFHQAMLEAGQLNELINELEETSQLALCKELRLLASILRSATCLLQSRPADLTMVIQIKLLPFLDIFPDLVSYAKQIYQEGLKKCGVSAVRSSVSCVPSIRTVLPGVDVSPIVDVLQTQCETIAMLLDNGCVWAWKEDVVDGYRLINSSDLLFSSAKSAGNFLMLSTKCNRMLLCNMEMPTLIYEIDAQKPVTSSPAAADTAVQGFLIVNSRIFVWFRDANYVRMFDLNTGRRLGQLECQYCVTCVSCSSNEKYIFCGQEKSTVSIFDIQDEGFRLVMSSSSSAGTCVIDVLHSELRGEMSWVDSFGNVFVWNIQIMVEPTLVKECCNLEDQQKVLHTEHSPENRTFLICKQAHIVLWDTSSWTVSDQFKAPRNRSFIQAVLSSNCSLIIASLENCQFLLVWKRITGQCILRLDIGHTQALKMIKYQSTLVAIAANGFLTAWDLDLMLGASSVSKTGIKIKSVLVSSQGEHIYTTDGSDGVFKWGMLTGTIEGCFCHGDPVEHFKLTVAGEHLVTSDSSGDIYIWKTDTGENQQRIHGNHPSHLLITPNSHFVVSLCENSFSRVWKLNSGHVVCKIHLYLKNAVITPESTFVLGLHKRDLLAVSLWSGCISKRFSCSSESDVMAFQPLLDYTDYVALITSSGDLYTWNLAEETICQQVQLCVPSLNQLDLFQISSSGTYAMISTAGATISIIDTLNGRLYSLETTAPILFVSLTVSGSYIVFICDAESSNCVCDFHSKPVLKVVQASNGRNVGVCYLCKNPSALTVTDDSSIYVGFEDGSVGIYVISDEAEGRVNVKRHINQIGDRQPYLSEEPKRWQSMESASIVWVDSSTDHQQC